MDLPLRDFADFVFLAASSSKLQPEVRVITLSHFAFETEYPLREVVIQPQVFWGNGILSIALDDAVLDDSTYEIVLQILLNLSDDVNLNVLHSPHKFGQPIAMKWHDIEQRYVRRNEHVSEQTTFERVAFHPSSVPDSCKLESGTVP